MEKSQWAKDVDVYFQPKAWADTDFCVRWALCSFSKMVDKRRQSVLFCDNLGSQTSEEFLKILKRTNTKLHLLEKNCTDELQVIDAGIGKSIKTIMGDLLDEWLGESDENLSRWTGGLVPAWERRVLMTQLVSQAWKVMFDPDVA